MTISVSDTLDSCPFILIIAFASYNDNFDSIIAFDSSVVLEFLAISKETDKKSWNKCYTEKHSSMHGDNFATWINSLQLLHEET